MFQSRLICSAILAGALATATAGIASEPAQPVQQGQPEQSAKKGKDPNEKICESQGVLGSRLSTRRVCATRAEWAERRQRERDVVDRTQTQQCAAVNGVCSLGN